jgi:thiol-disulfide isomerase/thioredoxin
VADGYEVQGAPWFVETNAAGKIVWYQEVYTQGWPRSLALLEHEVKQSLSAAPAGAKPAQKALAESPAPLASLHSQGSVLLPGGQDALDKRITSLERDGYPIVVNIWAQWCGPCQKEFGLFAKASQLYGRRVAFLGADVDDNSADATAFLKAHHVSYPSYSVSDTSIEKILAAGLSNTPTTIYIKPDGKVSHISPGQYRSLGALDGDIQSYTLG